MDEYIEREAVLKIIYDIKENKEIPKNYGTLLDIIRSTRNLPTADVVEVKHGEWVRRGYEGIMTHCSECLHRAPFNNHQELILSNYCPNCGAKMDGENK